MMGTWGPGVEATGWLDMRATYSNSMTVHVGTSNVWRGLSSLPAIFAFLPYVAHYHPWCDPVFKVMVSVPLRTQYRSWSLAPTALPTQLRPGTKLEATDCNPVAVPILPSSKSKMLDYVLNLILIS